MGAAYYTDLRTGGRYTDYNPTRACVHDEIAVQSILVQGRGLLLAGWLLPGDEDRLLPAFQKVQYFIFAVLYIQSSARVRCVSDAGANLPGHAETRHRRYTLRPTSTHFHASLHTIGYFYFCRSWPAEAGRFGPGLKARPTPQVPSKTRSAIFVKRRSAVVNKPPPYSHFYADSHATLMADLPFNLMQVTSGFRA